MRAWIEAFKNVRFDEINLFRHVDCGDYIRGVSFATSTFHDRWIVFLLLASGVLAVASWETEFLSGCPLSVTVQDKIEHY